jgi:hypothetical protein
MAIRRKSASVSVAVEENELKRSENCRRKAISEKYLKQSDRESNEQAGWRRGESEEMASAALLSANINGC